MPAKTRACSTRPSGYDRSTVEVGKEVRHAKRETTYSPGNLPARARGVSVHHTVDVCICARHASYRHLGERRNRWSGFGCGVDRIPGMGRMDRVHPRRLDRGVAMGIRLPAHPRDVHQPHGRDLDYVPGADGALADPLSPICGKHDRVALRPLSVRKQRQLFRAYNEDYVLTND